MARWPIMKKQSEKTQKLTSDHVVHFMHSGKQHVGLRLRGGQLPLMVCNSVLKLLHGGVPLRLQLLLHFRPVLEQRIQLFLVRCF